MTIGEVARALARIEAGQADLRREISERLDRTVSAELYGSQHKVVLDEIAEIKGDLDGLRTEVRAQEQQRVMDRRWWLTAVLIPSAGLVASYVGPLLGGGGS
ncbi:hypothetical protein ACFQXA_38050 [Nocardiopsis composta]